MLNSTNPVFFLLRNAVMGPKHAGSRRVMRLPKPAQPKRWQALLPAPFAVAGVVILIASIAQWRNGNPVNALWLAAFAACFLGFAAYFFHAVRRRRARQAEHGRMLAEHPDEPWRVRPEWARGRIESAGLKAVWMTWGFALVWNAISSPILFAFRDEWAKGNKAMVIGLLFPLIGVGILVVAVRATIHWRKYGRSVFNMLSIPGAIGGSLEGALEIPRKLRPRQGFRLRLSCTRRTVTGSGKHRSVNEQLLWEEDKRITGDLLEADPNRTGVPIFFRVPEDQPQSLDGNPAIIWRLEVQAELPGVDYFERFEVPVFVVSRPPGLEAAMSDPSASYQTETAELAPMDLHPILVRETSGPGLDVLYPAARHPKAILMSAGFFALWTAVFWFLITHNVPVVFPVVWGLVDAIIFVTVLSFLFHSTRVQVGPDGLKLHHTFLVPIHTRVVRPEDILSIRPKIGMLVGQKHYYCLAVNLRSGRHCSAGDGIPDKRRAAWLAARLTAALHREAPASMPKAA